MANGRFEPGNRASVGHGRAPQDRDSLKVAREILYAKVGNTTQEHALWTWALNEASEEIRWKAFCRLRDEVVGKPVDRIEHSVAADGDLEGLRRMASLISAGPAMVAATDAETKTAN